jgi:hypothetical protein
LTGREFEHTWRSRPHMELRRRDWLGPAVLVLVLTGMVALLVVGNIPNR